MPAAVRVRTASPTVAPVVRTSSTTITPATTCRAARRRTRAGTRNAPSIRRRRSARERSFNGRYADTVSSQGSTCTGRPRARRASLAARAMPPRASNPRADHRCDGTGTTIVGPAERHRQVRGDGVGQQGTEHRREAAVSAFLVLEDQRPALAGVGEGSRRPGQARGRRDVDDPAAERDEAVGAQGRPDRLAEQAAAAEDQVRDVGEQVARAHIRHPDVPAGPLHWAGTPLWRADVLGSGPGLVLRRPDGDGSGDLVAHDDQRIAAGRVLGRDEAQHLGTGVVRGRWRRGEVPVRRRTRTSAGARSDRSRRRP